MGLREMKSRRLLLAGLIIGVAFSGCEAEAGSKPDSTLAEATNDYPAKKLAFKNIDEAVFNYAIEQANSYAAPGFQNLTAGVIPHHLTAAPMIGGFFRAAFENNEAYDTVVIVGPNHQPGKDQVVVSLKDWGAPANSLCDKDIITRILATELTDGSVAEDDSKMEDDHAVSALVPFVSYYWPEARIAPVLISRELSYRDTLTLADALGAVIAESGKRVLLVCSIDFSHYLTPEEAQARDTQTRREIERGAYRTIHSLTDANVDSPASLIIFLRYLEGTGCEVSFIDNANASAFTGVGPEGTTSYFVLTGKQDIWSDAK
jgi:AmmeMemoRadiSam system protein B